MLHSLHLKYELVYTDKITEQKSQLKNDKTQSQKSFEALDPKGQQPDAVNLKQVCHMYIKMDCREK